MATQDKIWKEALRFFRTGEAQFKKLLPATSRGELIDGLLKRQASMERIVYSTLALETPKAKPPPKEYLLQKAPPLRA